MYRVGEWVGVESAHLISTAKRASQRLFLSFLSSSFSFQNKKNTVPSARVHETSAQQPKKKGAFTLPRAPPPRRRTISATPKPNPPNPKTKQKTRVRQTSKRHPTNRKPRSRSQSANKTKKAKKEASARGAAIRTLLCIVKLIAGWIFSTPWRPGMPAQCAGGNEPAGIKSGASANDWKRCSSLTTKNPA